LSVKGWSEPKTPDINVGERNDNGAGERGSVNQGVCAKLLGVVDAAARISRPSASVLRAPRWSCGMAALRCRLAFAPARPGIFSVLPVQHQITLTFGFSVASARITAEHGRATSHVVLHLLHTIRRLDGNAPRIEGDRFPISPITGAPGFGLAGV